MINMIILDLETQDFDVKTGIYEVAMLVIKDGQVVDQLVLENMIDGYKGDLKYGFGRHNISKDLNYVNQFRSFILKYPYPIVAHNCSFDRKFLLYYKWIDDTYPCYCSLNTIRATVSGLKSYSLENLVKHFKIDSGTAHTAISDVLALKDILNIVKPSKWIKPDIGQSKKTSQYTAKIKARPLDEIDLKLPKTKLYADKVICFTGAHDIPRHTLQEIAILNGANISQSITKKTNLLVVGLNPGSKVDKAAENKIEVITTSEFLNALDIKPSEDFTYTEELELPTRKQPEIAITKKTTKPKESSISLIKVIGYALIVSFFFGIAELFYTNDFSSFLYLLFVGIIGLVLVINGKSK